LRYVVGKDGTLIPWDRATSDQRARGRNRDGDRMVSMAMGCPNKREQARRLRRMAAAGITDVHYEPRTGRLCFSGGYAQQKRLARLHGLEVG